MQRLLVITAASLASLSGLLGCGGSENTSQVRNVADATVVQIEPETKEVGPILPDAGYQLGWAYENIDNIDEYISKSKGKVMRGSVTPIPCGKHYRSRTGCYRWTPQNSQFEAHCFGIDLKHNLTPHLSSPKYWHFSSDRKRGTLGALHGPDFNDKIYIRETDKFKNYYRFLYATVHDCTPSPKIEPLILKTITTISPPKFPFTYNLENNARENCLLAEYFTLDSPTRYAFNRTQFYCLEADTFEDAEFIADSFKDAFSDTGAWVKKYQYVDKRTYYSSRLFSKQLPFTGLRRAEVGMSIVSPEDAENFYKDIGAKVEITKGKAVVVFVVDEMFEK